MNYVINTVPVAPLIMKIKMSPDIAEYPSLGPGLKRQNQMECIDLVKILDQRGKKSLYKALGQLKKFK